MKLKLQNDWYFLILENADITWIPAIGWNSVLYHSSTDAQQAEFQIFASKFWQIWPKLNVPCDLEKRGGNELFVFSKYGCTETIANNSRVKTVLK